MQRTLNLRALLLFLVILVVTGVGLFFLHQYQLNSQVKVFLDKSRKAEVDKDVPKAKEYLERYILLKPDDNEAMDRYALLLDSNAKNPAEVVRAFLTLEKALQKYSRKNLKPPDELHKRAATRAVELNRYRDALDHIASISKGSANTDLELKVIEARCEAALGKADKARGLYDEIISKDPTQIESYLNKAELARADRLYEQAELTLNAMIQANPNSPRARLARYNYLKSRGKLAEARQDLEIASRFTGKDKENADILLATADAARAEMKFEEARQYYLKGMADYPKNVRFYISKAQMDLALKGEGKAAAIATLKQAIPLVGEGTDEQFYVAKLLLDVGEKTEAVKLIEALRKRYGTKPILEFLDARMLNDEGKTGEAVTILERIKENLHKIPGPVALEAEAILSIAYEKLGNPERRLLALDRLIKENNSDSAQLARAETLVSLGNMKDALEIYRRLYPANAALRIPLVRMLLATEAAKPPSQRDWKEIHALLEQTPLPDRKSREYILSRFQYLASSGKIDELESAINQAVKDQPKEVSFWMAKAGLARQRAGQDPRSQGAAMQQVLQEAEQAVGDKVELRLARGIYAASLPRDQALSTLQKLEANASSFSPAEQTALFQGLADLYISLGYAKDGKRLLTGVVEKNPNALIALQRIIDLAIDEKDDSEAQRLIQKLRDLEGDEGYRWRLSSLNRLFAKLQGGERNFQLEARKLVEELTQRRPSWSTTVTLQGKLLELNGLIDQALEKYVQAIELGERNPEITKKTVQLLTARGRTVDANRLLTTVLNPSGNDPVYSKLATEVSLKSLDDSPEQRIANARKAVPADSKDYRDHLWLGNVLWVAKDKSGAEKAFKQAVTLAPEAPDVWANWLVYLIKMDRKPEAATELKAAEAALKDKINYVLIAYYDALGQRDKAEEQYLKFINDHPNDTPMLQSLVSFHFRNGEFAKAEALLEKLLKSQRIQATTLAWVRRNYAISLAAKDDYESFKKAQGLIEENLKENPLSPEDLRARALVNTTRPGPRQSMIKDLETSFNTIKPTPGEAILLAQLYENEGYWDKAKDILETMTKSPEGESPNFLAYYVQALIRNNDLTKASAIMELLEKNVSDKGVTIEPKVKLLFAQKKNKEALELLETQAEKLFKDRNDGTIFLYSANLLEKEKQIEAAEKMTRRFVAENGVKNPLSVLGLVAFLARHGRTPEAIQLCEDHWTKLPVGNVAMACVAALNTGKPSPQDIQRVETKLKLEMKSNKFELGVAIALADLFSMQKRPAEAEAIYRQILQQDKTQPIALNNLAWELSSRSDSFKEAIELINQAINKYGPDGAFLDTRGMIYFRNRKLEEAIKDLNEAVTRSPTAEHWLHLAYVLHKNDKKIETERAWKKTNTLGIQVERLSADDKSYYSELERNYRK